MTNLIRVVLATTLAGSFCYGIWSLMSRRNRPLCFDLPSLALLVLIFLIPFYPVRQNTMIPYAEYVESLPDFSDFVSNSILWYIWIVGFVISLGNAVLRSARFSIGVGGDLDRAPAHIQKIADDLTSSLGIKPLPVYINPHLTSPVGVGLFRRKIILSPSAAGLEDRDDLELVLRHEVAHFRWHHLWIKWLMSILVAIHWFNPIVRYLSRAVSLNMENACDEFAVTGQGEGVRAYYCELLLGFANTPEHISAHTSSPSLFREESIVSLSIDMVRKVYTYEREPAIASRVEVLLNKYVRTRKRVRLTSYISLVLVCIGISGLVLEFTEDKLYIIDENTPSRAIIDGFEGYDQSLDYIILGPYEPIAVSFSPGDAQNYEFDVIAFFDKITLEFKSDGDFVIELVIIAPNTNEIMRQKTYTPEDSYALFDNLNGDFPLRIQLNLVEGDEQVDVIIDG